MPLLSLILFFPFSSSSLCRSPPPPILNPQIQPHLILTIGSDLKSPKEQKEPIVTKFPDQTLLPVLRLFSKPVATGSLATVTCPHSCCRLPCSSHQRLRHHHPHSARQQPGSATTLALLTWLSGSAATSSASELDRACSSGDDASVEVRRSLRRRNHGGMLHRIVREKRRGEGIFDISPTFSPEKYYFNRQSVFQQICGVHQPNINFTVCFGKCHGDLQEPILPSFICQILVLLPHQTTLTLCKTQHFSGGKMRRSSKKPIMF